jgi:acyl-CoA thioester hydrolase
MSYRQLEESGVMLPVQHMEIEYLKPAFYDDLLTIRTTIKEMPTARITFYYEIFNEKGELLNRGTTDLVFVNAETMKPIRPPAAFLQVMKNSMAI